ncbi:UNVERIFIED_ORG: hypothetical protein HNP28_001394 [Comamonas terrigena]
MHVSPAQDPKSNRDICTLRQSAAARAAPLHGNATALAAIAKPLVGAHAWRLAGRLSRQAHPR